MLCIKQPQIHSPPTNYFSSSKLDQNYPTHPLSNRGCKHSPNTTRNDVILLHKAKTSTKKKKKLWLMKVRSRILTNIHIHILKSWTKEAFMVLCFTANPIHFNVPHAQLAQHPVVATKLIKSAPLAGEIGWFYRYKSPSQHDHPGKILL